MAWVENEKQESQFSVTTMMIRADAAAGDACCCSRLVYVIDMSNALPYACACRVMRTYTHYTVIPCVVVSWPLTNTLCALATGCSKNLCLPFVDVQWSRDGAGSGWLRSRDVLSSVSLIACVCVCVYACLSVCVDCSECCWCHFALWKWNYLAGFTVSRERCFVYRVKSGTDEPTIVVKKHLCFLFCNKTFLMFLKFFIFDFFKFFFETYVIIIFIYHNVKY